MSQAERDLADTLFLLREALLEAMENECVNDEDRIIIANAKRDLKSDSEVMLRIKEKLADDHLAEERITALNQLLQAVLEASSRGIVPFQVRRLLKVEQRRAQAKSAREGRATKKTGSPREMAICNALDTATRGWDGKKPFKLAESIATQLAQEDVKISSRAIRNRLEKWKLLNNLASDRGSSSNPS